ncbi:ATP-dependent RNA helicase mitochondrial [Micractinium conductrix]|uniref:RNA helicase n=1 Tax=Micractinium conductrix TaxID=554055 RepID=A0A2P6VC43_9CHLO|nr:ATP-dependent RNA helicase mitochondrial [Micractinium conductrix]|eukprot:PSC71656.1 ATP-dependent RNA helicase mitochondrial [Micractinium conductrix]
MSLAALRRARASTLARQLALLRQAAGGATTCISAAAAGGSASLGLPSTASPLWRYDSPMLRHLSSIVSPLEASSAATPAADVVLPPYEQLRAAAAAAAARAGSNGRPVPQLSMTAGERTHFESLLRSFVHAAAVQDQALAIYVNRKLYAAAAPKFHDFLLAAMDPQLCAALLRLQPGAGVQEALFPLFAQFVLERYTAEIKAYRDMVQTVDLRNPHQWFPMARALQRRIIYHAGPTNSGKTYNALQAMRAAKSGVYCGPLRLLAMEVYDTCNADGLYCNLVTGQERREVPGAHHTACTVEMVSMQRRVDVAVIDEVQMIGDDNRGWAWTRALMGVPANEVHLCGDGSAVPLVRKICEEMGEVFELNTYDRFTKLTVEEGGLEGGSYAAVQPGDCIVAFSRRDIYDIKQIIEQETKHGACVVYGALPPETRRQQARLFNEPDNPYRVLVASDAVGMGLNLNIRRIIFHSVMKHEGGRERVPVSVSMLKQIAGRAGRRSSQWPAGLATCRDADDVPRLQEALDVPLEELSTPTAGLFPEYEHFEVFAGQRPDEPYSALLAAFEKEALLDSSYFFCKQEGVHGVAQLLGKLELSIRDMFSFCMAPASATDPKLGAALLHFATKYSKGLPVTFEMAVPNRVPRNTDELRQLESAHQVAMLWLWLSYRFDEEAFPGREQVQEQATLICHMLDKGLRRLTRLSKSGADIADTPVRPELERIFKCFSGEIGVIEAQRAEQRAAEQEARRRERAEQKEAAQQRRLERRALRDATAPERRQARLEKQQRQRAEAGGGSAEAAGAPAGDEDALNRRAQRRERVAAAAERRRELAGEPIAAQLRVGKRRRSAESSGTAGAAAPAAAVGAQAQPAGQQQQEQEQWARAGDGSPPKEHTAAQEQVHQERKARRRELRRQLAAQRAEEQQRRYLETRLAGVAGEEDLAVAGLLSTPRATHAHPRSNLDGKGSRSMQAVASAGGEEGPSSSGRMWSNGWQRLMASLGR